MATPRRPLREMEVDPKLSWALGHREQFPVDLNRAPRERLLRIPGLADSAVARLIRLRRERPVAAADVRKLRVNWHQLRYFVTTIDHRPGATVPPPAPPGQPLTLPAPTQLPLFDAMPSY